MSNAGISNAETLEGRWQMVMQKIANAARRSGRNSSDVKLVAVSKTKPLAMIEEAVRAGQKCFGENYVHELSEKNRLAPLLEWHFIGSLQTNKVEKLFGCAQLIHSVDRLKLAEKISTLASMKNLRQDILLQVHIGGEATKHGASRAELVHLLGQMASLPGIRVCGLMSIPPLTESESEARGYFASLREDFAHCRSQLPEAQKSAFAHLSMGTSGDYEWAILEGATLVRVGTAIFGRREA